MINLTRWPGLNADNRGAEWRVESWDELFAALSTAGEFLGKWEHPGWSPAEFSPLFREAAHVQTVSALCLDYDHGETIDGVVERLARLAGGFLHTSRSHTPEENRSRVVLPFTRPVSAFEYPALWRRFAPAAGNLDVAPKDGSRFWYLPGSAGGPFETRRWDGPDLNPSEWLAKPDPTVSVAPVVRSFPAGQDASKIEERARKYIARMPESVAGQGGHQACWHVAIVLARGFGLSVDRTLALLREDFNPRCAPPWSDHELEHKAKSAAKSDRLALGYLLKDDREWEPRRYEMPPAPREDEAPLETEAPVDLREPGADEDEPSPVQTATQRYDVIELQSLCFEILAEAKKGKAQRGFRTGHYELDKMISGLRREHVTLLAASTSWGKSSWGVMVADENIHEKVPTLVVSVEDSKIMYGKRLVARRSGVNAMNLRDNDCAPGDLAKIAGVAADAEAEPFLLSGIGKTVEYLAQAIRDLVAERQIGLVICDYVQRFRTRQFAGDRRNQVTYVAETLSDAIKASGAAGVLLSQLKRIEGREPTMDDVKESGDLENMAEHVLLGYRAKGDGRPGSPLWHRYLLCPKNKDGPTATRPLELEFNERTANFVTIVDPLETMNQQEREAQMFEEEERRWG
jgi:hypothetical protein